MNRPVLPRGTEIESGVRTARILVDADGWQIYRTNCNGSILLVYDAALISNWDKSGLLPSTLFRPFQIGTGKCHYLISDSENTIASVKEGPFPDTFEQAYAFSVAIRESRKIDALSSFEDGIYIEQYSRILPTTSTTEHSDSIVLGRFLTGGVDLSTDQFEALCKVDTWMSPDALAEVIKVAGLNVPEFSQISNKNTIVRQKSEPVSSVTALGSPQDTQRRFTLPGRPELENFFNEHIVEIVTNAEKYKRMGIDFPSATILYGPPGCGKTFAVQKLVDFLSWPSYEINSGSIGSPYIHDTSKKISEVFDLAINNAPSVIIIDEMEAFLTDRNTASSSGQHHVEEVAEFLRRIPEAISNNVLIMAMTNMIAQIDPAILRRGRFDNVIAVSMPTKEEVASMLSNELKKLPIADDVSVDQLAESLKGRALSDATYVLKEAGRHAVKQDREYISMDDFIVALNSLPENTGKTRKIGF